MALKVKKGDTVQMLTGKDRGKQGRVLEARPRDGKVIVENLNIQKRHQKPRPIRDASRMGGAQMIARRDHRPGFGRERVERDGRLPDVQAPDSDRLPLQGREGRRAGQGARLQARRLRPGDRSLMAATEETYVPRLKQRYNDGAHVEAQGRAAARLDHAGADGLEDHPEHGRRRGQDRREADRLGARRADDHRRAARAGAPRPQVDRAVQDPRGNADRRQGDAARRPHVGVPRPARLDRAAAHPRLPRAQPRLVRRSRQLLDRASASRSSFRRSTTTASTRFAASTSRSRPLPSTTRRRARFSPSSACRSRPMGRGARSTWRRSH